MANREFVMLSESLDLSKLGTYSLGNWFCSEKLDGMRAIWLPDTRGLRVGSLPFANLDKDRTGSRDRMASGLWSRYARPIWAPESFLRQLPVSLTLDGELWAGVNTFQTLTSIARSGVPDSRWDSVQYRVFDSPCWDQVYSDGKIHNSQLKKRMLGVWAYMQANSGFDYHDTKNSRSRSFEEVYYSLHGICQGQIVLHEQTRLNWLHTSAVGELMGRLTTVLESGGEGLILRAPHSYWEPKRSPRSLKVKSVTEADGVIIGFNMGEGRLTGLIGSIQVKGELNGVDVNFGLSGLTDAERAWPSGRFSIGDTISYKYRDVTTDGQPREARFLRVRTDI